MARVEGFIFTQRSKADLITNLQLTLEKGELRFPFIRELVDELQAYAWDDKELSTDCVMALALACWAAKGGGATISVVSHPSRYSTPTRLPWEE